MFRQEKLIELIEEVTDGHIARFYDMITAETRAVVHFKDGGYCEVIARRLRSDQRTSLYGDVIAEALYMNDFVASTPVDVVLQGDKYVVKGTGQRFQVRDLQWDEPYAVAA